TARSWRRPEVYFGALHERYLAQRARHATFAMSSIGRRGDVMRTNIFLSTLVFITALASTGAAEETEQPASLHRAGWGAGLVFEGLLSMAVGGVFLANSFRACPPDPDGFGFGNFGCAVGKAADYMTAVPLLATGGVKTV